VFYDLNAFKVDYNRICECFYGISAPEMPNAKHAIRDKRRRVPAFDAARICNLHITSFDPGADDQTECATCQRSGLGLIEYLTGLPKLHGATIDFEFVFGFALFSHQLKAAQKDKHATCVLLGLEVGVLSLIGLTPNIRLSLPALNRAWCHLADSDGAVPETEQVLGEESIRLVLEYLQFECDVSGRVPKELSPFFNAEGRSGCAILRLNSAADSDRRLADFTIALTEVLSDIFMEDGGSESIQWIQLDGPTSCVRWICREGCSPSPD